jgi:16S rRNA (uracil1498-N3)-methyltransferase
MRVLVAAGSSVSDGQRIGLDDDEAHHLRVRRAKDGELVEILDGAGLRGVGRLHRNGKSWSVDIERIAREPAPAELTLAVAAGDRERFSWVVEKAVELGVTRIVPLVSARTTGVATGIRTAHLDRLRRLALQSSKQCGAAWALRLDAPLELDDFTRRPLAGAGWVADRGGVLPPPTLDSQPLSVVIGPEGGLTEAEVSGLLAAGYQKIVLGPLTLRFETAAVAAIALATSARLRGFHG